MGSNVTLAIDAALNGETQDVRADKYSASSIATGTTKFVIDSIIVNSDSTKNYTKATVAATSNLRSRFDTSSPIMDTTKAAGVTGTYKAKYISNGGYLLFSNEAARNLVTAARNEYGFEEATRTYTLTADEDVPTDIANYGDTSYDADSIGDIGGTSFTIDGNNGQYSINGSKTEGEVTTFGGGISAKDGQTLTLNNIGSVTYQTDAKGKNVYTFDENGKVNNVTVNKSINGFNHFAYVNSGATAEINNVVFYNNQQVTNVKDVASGIAVRNNTGGTITSISGDFINNSLEYSGGVFGLTYGGAVYNDAGATIGSITGNFINNYAYASSTASDGAAIHNRGTITSISGDFVANSSSRSGAVYNDAGASIGSISGRFINNKVFSTNAYASGGAITNMGTISRINADFIGNSSKYNAGAAIYNTFTATMSIFADTKDVVFTDNKRLDADGNLVSYNDIYNRGTLNLNAASGHTITFGGVIEGDYNQQGTTNINNDATDNGGTYIFNNTLNSYNKIKIFNDAYIKLGSQEQSNGTTTYGRLNAGFENDANGGTLDVQNNHMDSNYFANLTLNSDLKYKIDVDLANVTADYISAHAAPSANNIVIDDIALTGDISDKIKVKITDNNLWNNTVLSSALQVVTTESGVRYKLGTEKVTSGDRGLYLTAGYYKLPDAVKSAATTRTYTLQPDDTDLKYEIIDKNLGTMGGENATLTIQGVISAGTGGVKGNGYSGAIIGAGNTIRVLNVGGRSGSTIVNDGFTGFESTTDGAVFNNAGTLEIFQSVFKDNTTTAKAGAIANTGTLSIKDSIFTNNSATSYGGALYNTGDTTITTENFNVIFSNNTAARGGAIHNAGNLYINSPTYKLVFENNSSTTAGGGAIRNDGASAVIDNLIATFNNNSSATDGGAIHNSGSGTINTIKGAFTNNVTGDQGGAIYNSATIGSIVDTTFSGNSAATVGGAILNNTTGPMSIIADQSNVSFSDNYVGTVVRDTEGNITDHSGAVANDIHNIGTLNLKAKDTKSITFGGTITDAATPTGTINIGETATETPYKGVVNFVDTVTQNTLNLNSGVLALGGNNIYNVTNTVVNGGELDLRTNATETQNLGNLTLNSNLSYKIDVNGNSVLADVIGANTIASTTNNITVDSINFISDMSNKDKIKIATNVLMDNVILGAVAGDYYTSPTTGIRYKLGTEKVTEGTAAEQGLYLTSTYYRLYDAVHADADDRSYTITPDEGKTYETVDHDLGPMGGSTSSTQGAGAKLVVDGGETTKYGINFYYGTTYYQGVNIQNGQTLEMKNIGTYTPVIEAGKVVDIVFSDSDNSITGFTSSLLNNYGTLKLSDVVFANNTTAPIINNYDNGLLTLENLVFVNNMSSAPLIWNTNNTGMAMNGIFKNNTGYAMIGSNGTVSVGADSLFLNNNVTHSVVYSTNSNVIVGEGVIFRNNTGNNSGAAINAPTGVTINAGTIFDRNYSLSSGGGAISLSGGTSTITDTNFTGNIARVNGGAILNANASNLSILAKDSDVIFSDNQSNATFTPNGDGTYTVTDGVANDIYNAGTVSLNAGTYVEDETTKQRTITIGGGITGSNGTLNINNHATINGGKVVFNGETTGNTVDVYAGTLDNNAKITGNVTNRAGATVYSTANNLNGTVANAGTLNLEGGTTQGEITNYNSTNGTINVNNGLTVAHNISDNTINLSAGASSEAMNVLKVTQNEAFSGISLIGNENTVIDLRTGAIEHQNLGNITLNGDMRLRFDADLGLDPDGQHTHTAAIDTITGNVISAVADKKIYIDAISILYDAADAPVEFKFAQGTVKNYIDIFADYKETEIPGPTDNYLVAYENKSDGGYLSFDYAGLASAIQSSKDQKIFTMHHDDAARKDLGVLAGTKIQVVGNNYAVNGLFDEGGGLYSHLKGTVIGSGKTMEIENVGSVDSSGNVVKSWNNFTNNVTDSNGVINNAGTLKVTDSVFSNNSAANGGVIYNTGNMTLAGTNYFINNSATNGGAIYNTTANQAISGVFRDNVAATAGAVYTTAASNIAGATFDGNLATGAVGGGAVYFNNENSTVTNSNFTNNATAGNGGAIYNNTDSNLSIIANASNVSFSGNKSGATITYNPSTEQYDVTGGSANDIYNVGTINLKAANGKSITFGGTITDAATPTGTMTIGNTGTETAYTGTVNFNNTVTQRTLNLNSGTMHLGTDNALSIGTFTGNGGNISLLTDAIEGHTLGSAVTLASTINMGVDAQLNNSTADHISAGGTTVGGSGNIIINNIKLLSDSSNKYTKALVAASDNLINRIALATGSDLNIDTSAVTGNYAVTYDNGYLVFRNTAFEENLVSVVRDATLTTYELKQVSGHDEDVAAEIAAYGETGDQNKIGPMTGTTLTVSGTTNKYGINGNGKGGIEVGSGKTLTFENVGDVYGFDGNAVTNAGTLNVSNTKFTSGIKNTNTLNLYGNNIINGVISYEDDTNSYTDVKTGHTIFNSTVTQRQMQIEAGAQISIDPDNFNITGTTTNYGDINLSSGDLNAEICNMNPAGAVNIDGDVNNYKPITSGTIKISDTSSFNSALNKLSAVAIENDGDLYLSGENQYAINNISGSGILHTDENTILRLNGGTGSYSQKSIINTAAATSIYGSITTTDGIINNQNKTLNLGSGTLNSTIQNAGALNISGVSQITKDITGYNSVNGTLTLDYVQNSSADITQKEVTIKNVFNNTGVITADDIILNGANVTSVLDNLKGNISSEYMGSQLSVSGSSQGTINNISLLYLSDSTNLNYDTVVGTTVLA